MLKIKLNKQLQTIKLNNNLYLPFLIHNLPNKYNKIDIKNIIKILFYIIFIYIRKV